MLMTPVWLVLRNNKINQQRIIQEQAQQRREQEEAKKIAKEKLETRKWSRYTDEELTKKYNKLDRTIPIEVSLFARGEEGNKPLLSWQDMVQLADTDEFKSLQSEMIRRLLI